jgi:hypothetical protein
MLWKFSSRIRVAAADHGYPVRRIIAPVATLHVFSIFTNRPKINREKF